MVSLRTIKKFKIIEKKTWLKYHRALQEWASKNRIKLPYIPPNCSSSYHMFYLIMPNKKSRDKLISWLKKKHDYIGLPLRASS